MTVALLLFGNIILIGMVIYRATKTAQNQTLFNEIKYLIFFSCGWIMLSMLLGTWILFDGIEQQLPASSPSSPFKVATTTTLAALFIGSGMLNLVITVYHRKIDKT